MHHHNHDTHMIDDLSKSPFGNSRIWKEESPSDCMSAKSNAFQCSQTPCSITVELKRIKYESRLDTVWEKWRDLKALLDCSENQFYRVQLSETNVKQDAASSLLPLGMAAASQYIQSSYRVSAGYTGTSKLWVWRMFRDICEVNVDIGFQENKQACKPCLSILYYLDELGARITRLHYCNTYSHKSC